MPRGKTAKSQRTRDAIEEAARDVFQRQGYERATVREIASAAGVHPSQIIP